MRLKTAVIQGIARFAVGKPPLRRLLVAMLDRVPGLKQRLKRASAKAVASQRAAVASGANPGLLVVHAQLPLARHEQRRKAPAQRT